MTTLTPTRELWEEGLRLSRERVFSRPPSDAFDACEQRMLVESLESVMRPIADMLDLGMSEERALSLAENAMANVIGSLTMTLSAAEPDPAWRRSLHMLVGIKQRLKGTLFNLPDEHTTVHHGAQPQSGRA
ncbi:hypothetical protein [Methylobacterium dankookense]|uniref:Uncharacterized protein n=1 Tax=Methylobacterium dankookense TaxID=560405 RepID=A0A564G5H9_9HYPH|nr:hypothetical protein [Methylobacterium dankookense]GJD55213.1 hypothetical protein IFDJLNFL_1097 [Methylobacterium dankookense]VUF15208.1 hypothetical protein MTDSW087_04943 [Methylobacterium dankookense]